MKVLSIDCSSSTIGWSVLYVNQPNSISFVNCGYIKPNKDGNLIDRLFETKQEIIALIDKYKPDQVAVEEIIPFMQGASTAKTIIMLTTFNRMVCLTIRELLGTAPELFSVMSIRHGLKLNKILCKKEEMPELVAKHLEITFPYEYISKGKNKGKPAPESYDKADAIAVGLYYAKILLGQIKRPKTKADKTEAKKEKAKKAKKSKIVKKVKSKK